MTAAGADVETFEAMTHTYEFTSTVDDLLDAEQADRSMRIRPLFRWLLVGLSGVWLVGGAASLLRHA